jgi:hypothetical protein
VARGPAKTPLNVGEFLDERGLGGVERFPGGEHAGGETFVDDGIFAGDEDGQRRQSVGGRVARGGGFASFGARPGTVLGVGRNIVREALSLLLLLLLLLWRFFLDANLFRTRGRLLQILVAFVIQRGAHPHIHR